MIRCKQAATCWTGRNMLWCRKAKAKANANADSRASPFPLIHLILVQVSSQAILVGTEGLVSSVDVDRPGPGVKDAAVAVAPLNQGPDRVQYSPRVPGWGREKSRQKRQLVSSYFQDDCFLTTEEDGVKTTSYQCCTPAPG